MGLGLAVSWQNPDIKIYKDGISVASAYDLQPSRTYEIRARIWNSSTEAVVSGLTVVFSYLSFGAQTKSNFIGNTIVDLGVKGGSRPLSCICLHALDDPGHTRSLLHPGVVRVA